MNREIRFRGRQLMNTVDGKTVAGDWVYGYMSIAGNMTYIESPFGGGKLCVQQVDPSTVGQFTGLLDSDDNGVYEGDTFEITAHPDGVDKAVKVKFAVVWTPKAACFDAVVIETDKVPGTPAYFGLEVGDIHALIDFFNDVDCAEITGNIHEGADNNE